MEEATAVALPGASTGSVGGPAVILRLPRPGRREDFGGCHACPETDLAKRFPAWSVDEDSLLTLGRLLAQSPEPIHCHLHGRLHGHARHGGQHEFNYVGPW